MHVLYHSRTCLFFAAIYLPLFPRCDSRHDIVGLRIADKNEATLPQHGAPLLVQDPESKQMLSVRNNKTDRARYAKAYQAQRQSCEQQRSQIA